MRGKIIQYNGADGSGTIVADGRQYRFELSAWRSNMAPAVNKTVEIQLEGDAIAVVTPVGDDVLMKEKAAQVGDKLGAMWNKASASIQASRANAGATGDAAPGSAAAAGTQTLPAAGSIPIIGLIRERYGVVIPIAWFLFVLGTLAFNAASMSFGPVSRGWSMFDLASMMSQAGGSGGGFVKFLLILGYLSIGAPLVWRNRLAWLTLLLPLLAVLWAVYDVLHVASQMSMGAQNMIGDMYHTGFGFWLSLIVTIILGALAVVRFLRGK